MEHFFPDAAAYTVGNLCIVGKPWGIINTYRGLIVYASSEALIERRYREEVEVPASERRYYTFYDKPEPEPPSTYTFKRQVFPLRDTLQVYECPICGGKGGWYEERERCRTVCEKTEDNEVRCRRECSTEKVWVRCPHCKGEGMLASWVNEVYEWTPRDRQVLMKPWFMKPSVSRRDIAGSKLGFHDHAEGVSTYKPSPGDVAEKLGLPENLVEPMFSTIDEADKHIMGVTATGLGEKIVMMDKYFSIAPVSCINLMVIHGYGVPETLQYCAIHLGDGRVAVSASRGGIETPFMSDARRLSSLYALYIATVYILASIALSKTILINPINYLYAGILFLISRAALRRYFRKQYMFTAKKKRTILLIGDPHGVVAKYYAALTLYLFSRRDIHGALYNGWPLRVLYSSDPNVAMYESFGYSILLSRETLLVNIVYVSPYTATNDSYFREIIKSDKSIIVVDKKYLNKIRIGETSTDNLDNILVLGELLYKRLVK